MCVQRSEVWNLQALAILSAWNDVRSTVCLLQGGRRDFRPDNCCLNLLSLLEDISSLKRSASLVYFSLCACLLFGELVIFVLYYLLAVLQFYYFFGSITEE